ncbi:hypothetical protein COCMIDRAFT_41962 [Bipolaris oryzae ATCC 44560]|uniref:Uncharacterized protein n=1 Tax=Bipolaris oryzae ATCC 44560 TaxID=930090 RepID=W6YJE4_COCMI|nr:uncharacterized protein COCMIDRAFT_41962 [Bipolaris oryzae ATCC 44560]EUC39492.1 hypothetical protein COCMIDRAFT_41962 [Bipolaris oryzae ATCC 44560]
MSIQSRSGPLRPTGWALGGIPKKNVDIPVTVVFLFLYIIGAATHMTIFQYNKRRGHKFLFNGALFGFCMTRITTCTIRIASISLPANIHLAIAAQIFVAAGILLIFVINLLWSQRILRAYHPLGWHPFIGYMLTAIYVVIVLTLVMLITSIVQSFYTLHPRTHQIDRDIQLYGSTFFAIISFLPIPLVAIALILGKASSGRKVEKFGQGRHRTKIAVLLLGATLCCLGASYRAGTLWLHPVSMHEPEPARFYRGWFYFMNFGLEILIIYMYAIMRVDLRFWIPDGAKGPGSYRMKHEWEEEHARTRLSDKESLRETERKKNKQRGAQANRLPKQIGRAPLAR